MVATSRPLMCTSLLFLLPQCLGVVSLAVGLWLYVTANEYATFSAGEHLLGSVLLVSVGVAAVLVGFMGVVAALWESTLMASFVSVHWSHCSCHCRHCTVTRGIINGMRGMCLVPC